MKFTPATLLADFYKLSHRQQYPENTQLIYSNFTPRSNKYFPTANEVVVFGIQGFVKKYIIDYFNDNFFNRPKADVITEYKRIVKYTLGDENPDASHINDLHDLGYMPIHIKALPEGTLTPIRVPVLTIENTDPRFFWITNYLETIMSTSIWQPMTSATIAYQYRKLLNKHAIKTTGATNGVEFQGHDFSMRGMSSLESSETSGAGHLLSFNGTDTIPAIIYHENYYNANVEKELVGTSIPACYDSETEILTESGWKLFKDLKEKEKVAQYHEDGTVDFVTPKEYYNMPYKGKMIKFTSKEKGNPNYLNFMVTPNHRMVRRKKSDNSLEIFEAGSNKYHERTGYGTKNKVIVSGLSSMNKKNELSAIEKLKIAFQADGSFMSRKDVYTGEKTGTIPIRFSLKKDRKRERLEELLKEANVEYTIEKYRNGYYSIYVKTNVEFSKDFSWVNLDGVSSNWANSFIEELQYWDGNKSSKNTISYSSILKENIDIIQAIASISGYKSLYSSYDDKREDYERKTLHKLILTKNKIDIDGRISTKSEIYYDGTVHCVSVPTKMLIVRRNNVVGISGNTEHSVMCSYGNANEFELFKHLINEVYPKGFFSVVSDTWDFWKVVGEYLPKLKNDIMARDGRVVIRPDSGDPVKIIIGKRVIEEFESHEDAEDSLRDNAYEEAEECCGEDMTGDDSYSYVYKVADKYYKMTFEPFYNRYDKRFYYVDGFDKIYHEEYEIKLEDIGLIEALWNIFGGTVTPQGYKVLDGHIGAIYGDSITLERAEAIVKGLEAKGFASTNIVFGIGSYTYQYNTRDTFGFAMKATYAIVDGEERFLLKDPKTDDGTKKSLTGRVAVVKGENGKLESVDHIDVEAIVSSDVYMRDLLETVFKDGKLIRDQSLAEIRQILMNN